MKIKSKTMDFSRERERKKSKSKLSLRDFCSTIALPDVREGVILAVEQLLVHPLVQESQGALEEKYLGNVDWRGPLRGFLTFRLEFRLSPKGPGFRL